MDWLAGLLELTGSYILGSKSRWGFVLNGLGSLTWCWVACASGLYGLLLVALPAIIINLRNWQKWRSDA